MRRILGKHPSELTVPDLKQLTREGELWRESRFIEYKRQLPAKNSDSVRKFLETVSSFANTQGGLVIFGIKDQQGIPGKLSPLVDFNPDQDVIRLENYTRDHLDPPLTSIRATPIQDDGEDFLVLEIPRSLNGPHAVWMNKEGQYWRRGTGGKYIMDVGELREAFLESDAWLKATEKFRQERVDRIIGARTGGRIENTGPAVLLHILPLGPRHRIDIDSVALDWKSHLVPDLGIASSGTTARHNLNGGLVTVIGDRGGALVQYFRQGGIEVYASLDCYTFGTEGTFLDGRCLQEDLCSWMDKALGWMGCAEIEPPVVVYLSWLNVSNRRLTFRGRSPDAAPGKGFEEVTELQPEVILDDLHENAVPLEDLFAMMWQASGWDKSPVEPEAIG